MDRLRSIPTRARARAWFAGIATFGVALLLNGCGSNDDATLIGSGNVIAKKTPAMIVQTVRISTPFKTSVANGQARQIVLHGEDNLVAQIKVRETSVSKWEIVAPLDLQFEQHDDLMIEIPFLDMVSISYYGHVKFLNDPFKVWREKTADAGEEADAGAP